VTNIHTQKHLGYSSKPITDIVNIGIGGSDLGPYLVCEALQNYSNKNMNVHFVSNIDAFHISQVLQLVNPETVLFVIVSKSLRTIETKVNAETALKWLVKKSGCDKKILMEKHFVAVSNNVEEAGKMGIDKDNLFPMFDSVGGRFSLWSSAGISIPMYLGFDNFKKLLSGAYQMDTHFKNTEFNHNIPALLGFIGIWYTNFFKAKSHAVLPYDQALTKLSDYLQQSHMESNGKSVDRNGLPVEYSTCPIIFGTAGTNGQHSFYQLLHQGTSIIPADFLAPVIPSIKGEEYMEHHNILLGNFFGQAEALMCGKDLESVIIELRNKGYDKEDVDRIAPFKVHKGNNPTTSILYQELAPETLGKIIAMYEHKIFIQGVIWNIFSFDQWGVEFGKELASKIYPELEDDGVVSSHDSSTNGLINQFKKMRKRDRK
jgi:glucose-6-phosphate isomerase